MSPAGWEGQALDYIQSVLGHTDPKLASLLAGFSRLASSEEMPAHERVRSPLRHRRMWGDRRDSNPLQPAPDGVAHDRCATSPWLRRSDSNTDHVVNGHGPCPLDDTGRAAAARFACRSGSKPGVVLLHRTRGDPTGSRTLFHGLKGHDPNP